MITLYDFGNSVACQKVRVVMCEKGLDWETVKVDLFRAEQFNSQYLRLNPKGVVPTIVNEGKAVTESTLICEYLDDVFPEPRLVPTDPLQRARMRFWSKAVDEGLHEGVTEISFSAMFRERMRAMPPDILKRDFATLVTLAGEIGSDQPLSSARNRRSFFTRFPLMSGHWGCLKRR
jgi:ganglioside-induced differentiation-associated protein 1